MREIHSNLQNQLEVEPHLAPKLSALENPSRSLGSLPSKPERLGLWQTYPKTSSWKMLEVIEDLPRSCPLCQELCGVNGGFSPIRQFPNKYSEA